MIRIMILMNQPAAQFVFDIKMYTTPSRKRKMVSHRKRMKLMFASTKMGWAQHHPATMTDGGCYFCILVDGAVQKLWIPSTSIHVYIYIYIYTYIYLYVHTRPDPKPTSIQNDSCYFFPLKQNHKNTKTPHIFYKIQRGVESPRRRIGI